MWRNVKILFSHNEKIKTCKNVLICNPNDTYTRIQDNSMSFSVTTAKRTTREKIQSVQSWVYSEYSENTKANHQQTENIAFESTTAVSRSVSATKRWLPPISNQLPKLHCEKSKTETEGNYLKSSTTVHVFPTALENLPGKKRKKLCCTTLGWTNICSLTNQSNRWLNGRR